MKPINIIRTGLWSTIILLSFLAYSIADPLIVKVGDPMIYHTDLTDDAGDIFGPNSFIFEGLQFQAQMVDECGEVTTDDLIACKWRISYTFTKLDLGLQTMTISVMDTGGLVSDAQIFEYMIVKVNRRPRLSILKVRIGR